MDSHPNSCLALLEGEHAAPELVTAVPVSEALVSPCQLTRRRPPRAGPGIAIPTRASVMHVYIYYCTFHPCPSTRGRATCFWLYFTAQATLRTCMPRFGINHQVDALSHDSQRWTRSRIAALTKNKCRHSVSRVWVSNGVFALETPVSDRGLTMSARLSVAVACSLEAAQHENNSFEPCLCCNRHVPEAVWHTLISAAARKLLKLCRKRSL